MKVIERTNLVEIAQEEILKYIKEHGLVAGDSLPPEMGLAEALGVSRPVIREALSRLRMLGVIDSRRRRGLVVAEPDVFGACRSILDPAFLNEATQQELCEMRMVLEIGMAELIFARKTDDGIAELRSLLDCDDTAWTWSEKLAGEIDFHGALYRIAGNRLLGEFQALLQAFFMSATDSKNQYKERTVIAHSELVDALEHGTAESFSKAIKKHLSPYFLS